MRFKNGGLLTAIVCLPLLCQQEEGKRVVVIFEGRDAAGKGGVIKRITKPLNPRGLRVVALSLCHASASACAISRIAAALSSLVVFVR